jgi:hypothetical protein
MVEEPNQLEFLRQSALSGGGEAQIEKQHAKGSSPTVRLVLAWKILTR